MGSDIADLCQRLERMARDCEHSDDAETDKAGTFVPDVCSGFLYDDLMDAAKRLRETAYPKSATSVAQPDEVMVLQAVARGWCDPKNSHKVMDPDLVQSIASEVLALYNLYPRPDGGYIEQPQKP